METHIDGERIGTGSDPLPRSFPDTCVVCDLPVAWEAHCGACGWKERYDSREKAGDARSNHNQPRAVLRLGCTTGTPDVIVHPITRSEVSR